MSVRQPTYRRSDRRTSGYVVDIIKRKKQKITKHPNKADKGGRKKNFCVPIRGGGVDPPPAKKSTFLKAKCKNIQHALNIFFVLKPFFHINCVSKSVFF